MDSPDLQVKYHKLASEYSKLRAQNQVLKKAVIEEQGKSSHLKEGLRSRDQSLRKAEQENDSLSFRNQQLTKRLVLLQDDIEYLQSKPRKGQVRNDTQAGTPAVLDHSVYVEELELKIKENARLHADLSDTEAFYKAKISELEDKLALALKKDSKNSDNTKTQEQTLQNEIKKLETERIMQAVSAQQRESEITSLQDEIKSLKLLVQNTESVSEIKAQDGCCPALPQNSAILPSNLNLESPVKVADRISGSNLIKEFVEPIKELSEGFTCFFQSYSTLLRSSSSLSPIQSKFLSQLTDESKVWESLGSNYQDMASKLQCDGNISQLENLVGLDIFSKSVTNCSASLRKLLPVLSEKLIIKGDQVDAPWRSSLACFVACWAAITPYLTSLAAHNDGRTLFTSSAIGKILNLLNGRLSKLHSAAQELLAAWEIFIPQESDEEKITKHLQTVSDALSKISVIFTEKVVVCWSERSSSSSSPSNVSPGTPQSNHHPGISLLSSPDGSGGWSGGIHDGLQMADSEASLAQQLAQATSRLSKLEEEREHWRLEYQLLNHKFEKEAKKVQYLEERLQNLSNESSKESLQSSTTDTLQQDNHSTSLISEIVGSSSSAEEREKEIRTHFTNRCSHLYMQLSSCTSQAALYQNECETLIRRLAVSEESRVIAEQDVEQKRREISQIQETLSTTSRNYEEQISTMSEHLADLNEKITSQADLIEQLKFEIKKKGRK